MKVLFITPWYPSLNDSMSGLFVQKIVAQISEKNVDCRVISETNLWKLLKKVRCLLRDWGAPDLVHLHVTTKQGVIPLFLKTRYHIPYILTEHWSGYLPANGDYEHRCRRPLLGTLYRRFTHCVVANASAVTAVSTLLRDNMRRCGLDNPNFRVIYNVVDPYFHNSSVHSSSPIVHSSSFKVHSSSLIVHSSSPKVHSSSLKVHSHSSSPIVHSSSPIVHSSSPIVHSHPSSFLHVSCFDNRAKNVFGIIHAAALLRDRGFSFRLTMVGEGPDYDECRNLASCLNLNDFVTFTGTLQSTDVARLMSENDCFVLFSNYETAAVVLEEALSAGMNIISTPVGIAPDFPDRITLTPAGDIPALADAMQNIPYYTPSPISFADIPDKYLSLYRELVSPN